MHYEYTSSVCACGCGQMTNPGKTFVHGHNAGHRRGIVKIGHPTIPCLCGCGKAVTFGHSFVRGHNNRVNHAPPAPLIDRFWLRVQKSDACWLWTGATDEEGYGRLHTSKTIEQLAHRFSYECHVGPIPEGKIICHSCDVNYPPGDNTYRRCVRPGHLYAGTDLENARDRVRRRETWRHVVCPPTTAPRAAACG